MSKFLDVPEFYSKNGILTEPTAYDVVIRTQEDFDALLASDNGWFGAHSVLFDGKKGITFVFNCSDTNVFSIPNTVSFINGINGATIKIQSTTGSTSISGPKYSGSAPSNAFLGNLNFTIQPSSSNSGTNYFFQGMKNIVNCSVTANVSVSTSNFKLLIFGTCQNIINTKVSIRTTTGIQVIGFENCGNIYNCDVSLTCENVNSGTGQCFMQCYDLIGCSAEISGGFGTHTCYYDSNRLTNCTGTIDTSSNPGSAATVFNFCEFLSNCSAKLTAYNHITSACFFRCQKLSNCVCESIVGLLSSKIVYGFGHCSYCNGCVKREGGTFTNYQLWYGDNTNVDWDSCDKPDDYQLPYTNPNLLINPDFKINQRGSLSYSGVKYCVDRWKITRTNGTVYTITAARGLFFSANDKEFGIEQFFEPFRKNLYPSGQKMTMSMRISSLGTGSALKLMARDGNTWNTFASITGSSAGIYSATFVADDFLNSTKPVIYLDFSGSTASSSLEATLEWVKLEFGEVATPFVNPDYTTELLKCQRYYRVIGRNWYPVAGVSTGNQFSASLLLNPPMRVAPSLDTDNSSTGGWIRFEGVTNNVTTSNFSLSDNNKDRTRFVANISPSISGFGADSGYISTIIAALDAEI